VLALVQQEDCVLRTANGPASMARDNQPYAVPRQYGGGS